MPRGKLKGGGHGNGKGGRWDGGGGGLSKDQRDALDHVVKRQQKKEKREEEERIRRIVQRERDRDSDSSSQSDRDRKRSSKRHGRKHRGHSSDDSDSDDSAMSGEKQRRRQKERRDRRKAKKKKEIEEGKAAQLELKELREELTRLKASTETKEAKYSVAEVQEILAVCREKARTPTQQAKPPRDQPQPRSLFESITCSTTEVHIEELEEGKPASESESKASQIITLLGFGVFTGHTGHAGQQRTTTDDTDGNTFETLEASKRRGELHAKSAIPRAKQKRDSRKALMLGAVAAQICTYMCMSDSASSSSESEGPALDGAYPSLQLCPHHGPNPHPTHRS